MPRGAMSACRPTSARWRHQPSGRTSASTLCEHLLRPQCAVDSSNGRQSTRRGSAEGLALPDLRPTPPGARTGTRVLPPQKQIRR